VVGLFVDAHDERIVGHVLRDVRNKLFDLQKQNIDNQLRHAT